MTFDNLDMFHALVLFLLDIVYNDEKPEFIFLKENFNIHYTQFNDNDFLQISTIILVSKERFLKARLDESINIWTLDNCFFNQLLNFK